MELLEYIEAVEKTLKYWLDIHTNAKAWAQAWIIDNPQYTLKESPTISNNYFTFDLKATVVKYWVRDNRHLFNVCKGCGSINENGFDCGCDEPNEGEGKTPSIADLTDWLDQLGTEYLQFEDEQIISALEKDGFKIYRDALRDIISPVVTEVKDVLKSLHRAKKPEDTLQAVAWANHVCHVHGNIIKDYGDRFDIDYKFVDAISQNGLQSVFSEDEISEFLKG